MNNSFVRGVHHNLLTIPILMYLYNGFVSYLSENIHEICRIDDRGGQNSFMGAKYVEFNDVCQ